MLEGGEIRVRCSDYLILQPGSWSKRLTNTPRYRESQTGESACKHFDAASNIDFRHSLTHLFSSSAISSRYQVTEMPSSEEGSISRLSRSKVEEEDFSPRSEQTIHPLRRKKSRIFHKASSRGISLEKRPSFSDSEDAPNRPHIVPPREYSSDPENYNTQTREEKFAELTKLLRVPIASSNITLQRLGELESAPVAMQRKALLSAAKSAVSVAQAEYTRVHGIKQSVGLLTPTLRRNAQVPLPYVQSYREYLRRIQMQAKQLHDDMRGLFMSQEGHDGIGSVQESLEEMSALVNRRDVEAEMMEIRWLVQRKCMFWAAVDLLTADTLHLGAS
jgi:hypothetical protein